MKSPIKRVLNILNRELKLANSTEAKAILSSTILEVQTNLITFENEVMSSVFDSGFSLGSDAILNDKSNITGREWIEKNQNNLILCEICDSEIIPNCEYEDCPNKF
jgi:hypothetical protein